MSYLDLTWDNTYQTPITPTIIIVQDPKPGSAPFHDDGSCKTPSPFVDTSQTKYDDDDDMRKIEKAMIYFTWSGNVFPVA